MWCFKASIILVCAYYASINKRTYAQLDSYDSTWLEDGQDVFTGGEPESGIGAEGTAGLAENLPEALEADVENDSNLTVAEDGNQALASEEESVKLAELSSDTLPVPAAAPITGTPKVSEQTEVISREAKELPVSTENPGVEKEESGSISPQGDEEEPSLQDSSLKSTTKPSLRDLKAAIVDGEVRTSISDTSALPASEMKEGKDSDGNEDDDEVVEETSSKKPRAFNFASHDAGAIVLDKAASAKGFSNLLDDDKDKYGISPCSDKKWVVIGLSEDIVVTSVVIANYEKYSSMLNEFQVLAATSFPTEEWMNLGSYNAAPYLGEQTFNVTKATTHTRYLKFRFNTHYDNDALCTLSQLKVHGTTVIASLQQELAAAAPGTGAPQVLEKLSANVGAADNETSDEGPAQVGSGDVKDSQGSTFVQVPGESVSASAARLLESVLDEERAELESREEADENALGMITPSAVPVASGADAIEKVRDETSTVQAALSPMESIAVGADLRETTEVAAVDEGEAAAPLGVAAA